MPASSSSSIPASVWDDENLAHYCAPVRPLDQRRTAGEGGIEIKLADMPPRYAWRFSGRTARPSSIAAVLSARGFLPRQPQYPALAPAVLGFCQHRPGLSDACAGTEETFSFPRCGAAVCSSRRSGSGVRVRYSSSLSSARLSSTTLTPAGRYSSPAVVGCILRSVA